MLYFLINRLYTWAWSIMLCEWLVQRLWRVGFATCLALVSRSPVRVMPLEVFIQPGYCSKSNSKWRLVAPVAGMHRFLCTLWGHTSCSSHSWTYWADFYPPGRYQTTFTATFFFRVLPQIWMDTLGWRARDIFEHISLGTICVWYHIHPTDLTIQEYSQWWFSYLTLYDFSVSHLLAS